jgi:2-aminoethylphosphonate-pyruvate transaminase
MTSHCALLLTPGPLTTAASTREAMLRDWGSREPDFIALTRRLRSQLLDVIGTPSGYAAVPLQGSGTYAIEATLSTLLGPRDRLLVMSNGVYGKRIATIAERLGHSLIVIDTDETAALDPQKLDAELAADSQISHVAMAHGETSSGRINPIEPIVEVVASHGRALLIDAMSTFGAIPIDVENSPIAAVIASSNKCLEGVPGIGFAIARISDLQRATGVSRSLSLDLHAQWRGFEGNGQWRFTPPVQVIAAAVEALNLHASEGGVSARHARYAKRAERLVRTMESMGLEALLPADARGPCIVAFRTPEDLSSKFEILIDHLRAVGIAIYPGKLTVADTFRIGCMGAFDGSAWERFFDCFGAALCKAGWRQEAALAGLGE